MAKVSDSKRAFESHLPPERRRAFWPRSEPIYPPIPPGPDDPDYGLIDKFWKARKEQDVETMKECVLIAYALGGTYDSAAAILGMGRRRNPFQTLITRLGLRTEEMRAYAAKKGWL